MQLAGVKVIPQQPRKVRMKQAVVDFVIKRRSELLTCAFMAQMLASPLADKHRHLGELLALVLVVLIFAGASYMANRRILRVAAVPVAGLWLVARTLEAFGDGQHFYTHLAPVAGFALSCTILWAILDRFDRVPYVTSSVIAEAFTSYLIIAIAFSQLYWMLSRILPTPFNEVIPAGQSSTYLYFSMITLSGVGYGGIMPINPYIRLIAGFENMIGIFYVAVIVARLVSAYHRNHDNRDNREPSQFAP
jgi:voltage-gated potassium channel